mgnify:CR=1 FL=1
MESLKTAPTMPLPSSAINCTLLVVRRLSGPSRALKYTPCVAAGCVLQVNTQIITHVSIARMGSIMKCLVPQTSHHALLANQDTSARSEKDTVQNSVTPAGPENLRTIVRWINAFPAQSANIAIGWRRLIAPVARSGVIATKRAYRHASCVKKGGLIQERTGWNHAKSVTRQRTMTSGGNPTVPYAPTATCFLGKGL